MSPAVIAHRGASAARQENTVDAFRHAVELGADWIELDARRSADDVLVVHHDACLSDGTPIRSVAAADLPDWLPTLAEAMDAAEGVSVNIEIKNDPNDPDYDVEHMIATAVAGLAIGFRPYNELLITSFNRATLDRVGEADSQLPRGLLTATQIMDVPMMIERVVSAGMQAISPHFLLVDKALIAKGHAAGLQVNCWTVNDPEIMVTLAEWGIDGIVTDKPDVAREALDA